MNRLGTRCSYAIDIWTLLTKFRIVSDVQHAAYVQNVC